MWGPRLAIRDNIIHKEEMYDFGQMLIFFSDFGFGGGRRGCIGEVFSKSRLFLFLCMMIQRFTFLPADGEPLPEDDPRNFIPALVLKPPPYRVKIAQRS